MRDRISSSAEFDDPRYWRFERSSGLPFGYFGPTHEQRATLRVILAALVIFALAVAGLIFTAGEVSDEEIRTTPRAERAH